MTNLNEPTFERCPHDRENPYVMISREMAQDKSISPKAKGVLLYLLSLPKDWKIYHSQLQDGLGIGEDYLNSALEELMTSGYADRTRERDKGVFQPYRYKIREFKKCSPDRENRPGSSGPVNPVIQSKETTSTKETTTDMSRSAAVFFDGKSAEAEKPEVDPILDVVDIPIDDKRQITRDYSADDIKQAVKWATHPNTLLTKGLAPAIKWACKAKPQLTPGDGDLEKANREYAAKYDGMTSKSTRVTILRTYVEIAGNTGPAICLSYDLKGFMEKFIDALKKNKFNIVDIND